MLSPCVASAKIVVVERNYTPKQNMHKAQQPYYPDQYYGNSRQRVKDMQQQKLQSAQDELVDDYIEEQQRPLTRQDFEEILDKKLDEKLGKKQEKPEPAEASPFGAVGGIGQVGGLGGVGTNRGR
jgi:hypothetical protein